MWIFSQDHSTGGLCPTVLCLTWLLNLPPSLRKPHQLWLRNCSSVHMCLLPPPILFSLQSLITSVVNVQEGYRTPCGCHIRRISVHKTVPTSHISCKLGSPRPSLVLILHKKDPQNSLKVRLMVLVIRSIGYRLKSSREEALGAESGEIQVQSVQLSSPHGQHHFPGISEGYRRRELPTRKLTQVFVSRVLTGAQLCKAG